MKTTVMDICEALESWAPPGLAYSWDRIGLSVGDPEAHVGRVLVCLSVTRDAFAAARKTKAQMIVSHHPLIWEPLKTLRADDPHARLCLDIAATGIACFAMHTNLDVVAGGVSRVLGEAIGLRDMRPLLPVAHAAMVKLVAFVPESHLAAVRDAVSAAGAGVIGNYTHCSFSADGIGTFLPGDAANPFSGQKGKVNEEPERRFETLVPKPRLGRVLAALFAAHPYEEVAYDIVMLENADPSVGLGVQGMLERAQPLDRFAEHVRNALKLEHLRVTGPGKRLVRRVAAIGGSGGGQVAALPGDVDVLVTGDVGYHDALTAQERGLAVVDAGHAGSERPILEMLKRFLAGRFSGVRVSVYGETDCFQWVGEKKRKGRK